MSSHSKIGASGMYRWSKCPGSVKLSEGIESRSSVFAEEGTKAHELGEKWLKEGETALAGYPIDMVEHVSVYVDAVAERQDADPTNNRLLIEQRFHLHELHSDLFGTSDAIVWQPAIGRLSVIDLKYGAGVPVEVEDNPQLLYYGLGALLANKQWKPHEVEVVIVQPRCPHPDGPVRSQVLQVVDLLEFAADLVEAVKRTEEASEQHATLDTLNWMRAYLNPGDHCRWCPAAAICPSQRSKAQELAKIAFAPGVPYDAQQLADTLEWLPILEAWIKNTREFAYAEAEKGHDIPRHKLVEKRATRKWRDEAQAVEWMRANHINPFGEPPVISPATLEKQLPKDQRGLLDDLCIKESSGHTLVHESDRREAIEVDAKSAFSEVKS
ncbi:MAG: DUF2800 domain-containing protein [Planctomycetota bacterium]